MINRFGWIPVVCLLAAPLVRADEVAAPASATPPAPVAAPSAANPPAAALPSSAPDQTAASRPTTYTVVTGDTLWDLSKKFGCSVGSIKKLNGLKKTHLKPGQVLKIPPARAAKTPKATAADPTPSPGAPDAKEPAAPKLAKPTVASVKSTAKSHKHPRTPVAQPVQDFDVPASTFASCPTPPANLSVPDDAGTTATTETVAPAVKNTAPASHPLPARVVAVAPAPAPSSSLSPSKKLPAHGASTTITAAPRPPTPTKSFGSALADFFNGSHPSESGEWGNRFLTEARNLAAHGVGYNQSFRPEGASHSWVMDCSNTSRYLYQVTAGIELPRTASDQYYYLHLQDKAWDVPTVANGFADCNFLRANLKPGDLLFWENTYRPDRQPPITHVMIFLGSNEKGQWIMAGSQSSHGGQYNPHRSGPDVYVFDPTRPSGGYTTWLGLVHHQGRFCAYGRPLEADQKKLSVATTN